MLRWKFTKRIFVLFQGESRRWPFWVGEFWWNGEWSISAPCTHYREGDKKTGDSKCAFKKNFWYGKCTSFLPPCLHLPDDIVNSHCSYFASPLPPLAIVTWPLMRIFPLQVSESVPEEVRKWLASTFAKQEQVHVGDGHGQVMMSIFISWWRLEGGWVNGNRWSE